jgi:flagellar biosynthesis protein FliR
METVPVAVPLAETLAVDPTAAAVVAAGLLARIAAALVAGSTILPGISSQILTALAVALTAVSLPTAVVQTSPNQLPVGPVAVVLMLFGEMVIGGAMGTAAAAMMSAAGWAGGLLGSVAGLSWADDFDPDGDAQSAGIARLAWWMSCGGFLSAGGLQGICVAILDGIRHLPVGAALGNGPEQTLPLFDLGLRLPAVALAAAVTLAVPGLVAVLCFHLTAAICIRAVPFSPGPGLLQACAALVLLAAISLGADAWSSGFCSLLQGPLEDCFLAR